MTILLVFSITGIVGVIKEKFYLTVGFVVVQVLLTIFYFVLAVFNGIFLFGLPIGALILSIISLLYLRDLYIIKINKEINE